MDEEYLRWLKDEVARLKRNLDWARQDLAAAQDAAVQGREVRQNAAARIEESLVTLAELDKALTSLRAAAPKLTLSIPESTSTIRRLRRWDDV